VTRPLALALTVLTGFTGLVYQVTWQRYLAALVGSHSEATASVLGIFLGGLSLGYALFGRVTRRLVVRQAQPRLLTLYGGVEAAIGVFALAFPTLFALARHVSLWAPRAEGPGFAFDVMLCALLVGPPAVLMGGTIPILTQALARSVADATRFHAFVYGFNTVGAFAGALAAGFTLVPWLGLAGVLRAMAVVNLAVGAIFVGLDRRASRERAGAELSGGESDAGAPVPAFVGYAAVAVLSGFAMMTLETVLIRLGGFALGSSQFTFAMVVAAFVLCIALGSFAVSALPRVPASALLVNQTLLAALLILLYALVPSAPYWAHVLRSLYTTVDAAFFPYYIAAFVCLLAVVGLPVALSGATLPLIFHHLRRHHGDLGRVAGRLYSWNTLGSLLGALLGGYLLLFWLDLHQVYSLAVLCLLAGAFILAWLLGRGNGLVWTGIVLLPVCALFYRLEAWSPNALAMGAFRAREALPYTYTGPANFVRRWWKDALVIFYEDDPTSSVAVFETFMPDKLNFRALKVNGKPDSATAVDVTTTGLLGLLPALFAESTERTFVIGYGTGVSVGELAALETTREVVVAEISSGVVAAAPLFDFANQGAASHPKVRILRSDAYRALQRSEGRFDVIVSEPSNPWVNGVEMLYSIEFLQAARERLAPGGVLAQWFHQYETDDATVSLVLRSYAAVFEHVSVWYGAGADLILLGFRDPDHALDVERLQRRAARSDFAAGLRRSEVPSFPALLAHEIMPVGVLDSLELEGPVHTLDHPRLSHQAGRAYFRGASGYLPFSGVGRAAGTGAANSLLRRYRDRRGRSFSLAEERAVASETCRWRIRECSTLLAAWRARWGESDDTRELLQSARRQQRSFGGRVDRGTVERLGAFFSSDGESQPVALARARQASADFERYYLHAAPFDYYLHAAPFDPAGLLRLWERCRDDDDERACERGLSRARSLVGASPSRPRSGEPGSP
jgi:predicted membrane-bound spermidine synthase